MNHLNQNMLGLSGKWPKNAGMVCGVPFLASLFLLTLGILILPKYPVFSPFLFFACYLIWKKSPAPRLSGYRTLKDVHTSFQGKALKVTAPPEDCVTLQKIAFSSDEPNELDKVA